MNTYIGKSFINGDSLKEIDKLDNDYDICFTSPPYNLHKNNFESDKWGTIGKIQKYTNHKEDKIVDYASFLEEVVLKCLEKCEYVFLNIQSLSGNKKDIIELNHKLKDYYCDTIIWNKSNGIPNGCNKRVMTNVFEYIYIYSKKPSRAVGTKVWRGNVKNVINLKGNQRNEYSQIHKALFPIELPMYILENFVKNGGKVLDCFGGLGTTAIAASKLGMSFTSIELVEKYHIMAIERFKKEREN